MRTAITATLSVRDWARALEFYKTAFGATELYRVEGGGVAQLAVSGAEFWLAEEAPEHLNFSPEALGGCSVRMLLIVEDPAAVCARTIAAGAREIAPVADEYGWRLGRIVDPFGHHWEIGKPLGEEATKPDRDAVDSGLARHGHISYLEIPAVDPRASAAFYEAVFGWRVRLRPDGDASFDDGSGAVIGRWLKGRAVAREPGLLAFIYVDRITDVVERVVKHGGEIVKEVYPEGNLLVATFRDPAGNLMGVWQAADG